MINLPNKISVIGWYTIVRREIVRFMRIWIQTLIPPVITTSLYFLIFGELIGSRIGDVNGVPYSHFIAPGLVMMSILTSSYSNITYSFFGSKMQKSIEELMTAGLSDTVIILGYLSGAVIRGLLVGTLVLIVSWFYLRFSVYSIGLMLSMALLTSLAFSLLGFMNALLANNFDDINIVPTFVLSPLIYLGGVFYSISMLPGFWQTVAQFNPLLYVINGFRYSVLGHSDVTLGMTVVVLLVLIVVLYTVCLKLMRKPGRLRS